MLRLAVKVVHWGYLALELWITSWHHDELLGCCSIWTPYHRTAEVACRHGLADQEQIPGRCARQGAQALAGLPLYPATAALIHCQTGSNACTCDMQAQETSAIEAMVKNPGLEGSGLEQPRTLACCIVWETG